MSYRTSMTIFNPLVAVRWSQMHADPNLSYHTVFGQKQEAAKPKARFKLTNSRYTRKNIDRLINDLWSA